jgi:hypothetical protein
MREFIGLAVCLTASMFGLLGGVAILMAALFLGVAYHWVCFGLLLLVPIWMAGAFKVMSWSYDFEHRRPL